MNIAISFQSPHYYIDYNNFQSQQEQKIRINCFRILKSFFFYFFGTYLIIFMSLSYLHQQCIDNYHYIHNNLFELAKRFLFKEIIF